MYLIIYILGLLLIFDTQSRPLFLQEKRVKLPNFFLRASSVFIYKNLRNFARYLANVGRYFVRFMRFFTSFPLNWKSHLKCHNWLGNNCHQEKEVLEVLDSFVCRIFHLRQTSVCYLLMLQALLYSIVLDMTQVILKMLIPLKGSPKQ